jgi:hypothetical protein
VGNKESSCEMGQGGTGVGYPLAKKQRPHALIKPRGTGKCFLGLFYFPPNIALGDGRADFKIRCNRYALNVVEVVKDFRARPRYPTACYS